MPRVILFHFTWLCSLLQLDWKVPIIKVIEICKYYLNMSHGKMSDFVSIPLFGLILVIKLRNFNFESHWNILVFLDKKKMVSDLNMSYGKMPDLVLFPCFSFTLVIKLRNFDFKSHYNTLVFSVKKIMSVLIMFCQTMSDLV